MTESAAAASYLPTVETGPGGTTVRVPARRSYVALGFLCAWLAGWLVGESRTLLQLLSSTPGQSGAEKLYLVYWLCIWTFGGGIGLVMLLWNLGGRERIVVNDDALSIRLAIFGIGFTRRYELRYVKNLRMVEKVAGTVVPAPATIHDALARLDGPLAFDYAGRIFQFGGGIDAVEARRVLSVVSDAVQKQLAS